MNKFNLLYNLILLSIINLNSASRKALLQKSLDNPNAIKPWLDYLTNLNNNKLADFLCKYVANGTIIDGLDKRINTVLRILELNDSIDTQHFQGTLDLFIKTYLYLITKALRKAASKSIDHLDCVPEFFLKKVYDNGVVIYLVEDTKWGQAAVRLIVDQQFGSDANPWCLIARKNGTLDDAWTYWQRYGAFPKHIAFQNGKLIGFCADSSGDCTWWDRNDRSSTKLKLLDGSYMLTDRYEYDTNLKLDMFFENHPNIKLNGLTGLYDVDGDIAIRDVDIICGKLPVKFGTVTRNFDLDTNELVTLEGCPKHVKGCCMICCQAIDTDSLPKFVDGTFTLELPIRSLQGIGTKEVGANFNFRGNYLQDLRGLPKIKESIKLLSCGLRSLYGCPQLIHGNFSIQHGLIISLQEGPKRVQGLMGIYNCNHLESLKGCPEFIGNYMIVKYCDNFKKLDYAPDYIKGSIYVSRNVEVSEEFKLQYTIKRYD